MTWPTCNSLEEIENAKGYITAAEVLALVAQLKEARTDIARAYDLADAFDRSHYHPVTECGGFLRDALDGHVDADELERFLFPHKPGGAA